MRIKNVSNNNPNAITVRITLPKKGGGYEQIELPPNHSVYGEIMDNNSSLRIYVQKRFIEILEDEKKPNDLDYYKAYNNKELDSKKIPDSIKKKVSASIKEKDTTSTKEEVKELIEVEILVPEGAVKNKGGRPKGSKNKPKRGPKKKKK